MLKTGDKTGTNNEIMSVEKSNATTSLHMCIGMSLSACEFVVEITVEMSSYQKKIELTSDKRRNNDEKKNKRNYINLFEMIFFDMAHVICCGKLIVVGKSVRHEWTKNTRAHTS